jgi:hypothetical protein
MMSALRRMATPASGRRIVAAILVMGRISATASRPVAVLSWRAPRPNAAVGTSPAMRRIGTPS